MRLEERRTLRYLLYLAIAGAVGAVLFFPALYNFGLLFAPPRPVPATTPALPPVRDAIWARAEGGRATGLRPISAFTIGELAACMVAAPGENDNQRSAACGHVVPGMPGLEYLATLHIQDHGVERNSFRGGHAQFATIVWMTRSWTREEFLDTLAARGNYGFDWRGIDAAARGYFGRAATELTLPQVAMLASRLGDLRVDPWCGPVHTTGLRNRVLERMRDNGTIDEPAYRQAQSAPLDLVTPPGNRPPCR